MLCLIFVIGLSGLSARLVYLHVVKASHYAKKSDRITSRTDISMANRGSIVDANNQLIARNNPRVRLALDKKLLHNVATASLSLANKNLRNTSEWGDWDQATRNQKVRNLALKMRDSMTAENIINQHIDHVVETFSRPLGLSPESFRKKMRLDKKKQVYVVINSDLSEDDAEAFKLLTRDHSVLHAFTFEEIQKRWYAFPEMASHIIGFVGSDDKSDVVTGKAGIESKMNHKMSGKDGYIKVHRDRYNLLAVAKPGEVKPPVHGLNVQLTLDMGVQAILEEELDAGLAEFEAKKGSIVMLDPHTGAVLGMASRPSYNLNTRENIAENGYDFATQAVYEPGSTIKIIAASGALNEGFVQPGTRIDCQNGVYNRGSVKFNDHHPYGMLSVEGILMKSSNIGSYKLALQLGAPKFFEYLRDFGFGSKTNILMSSESSGTVRNTGNPTDFAGVSYGYATGVTPLQMACAYSVIANGGKLMEPQLLKSVMANDGSIKQLFEPKEVRRVIKESTAKKMRRALSMVVSPQGTARRAAVDGYQAAGKTGTTKKYKPGGGYYSDRYTVSFAGMLPAENPAFVCVVVIDDPQTKTVKRYGGTIAAPIFSKVATRVANRMGLKHSKPLELAKNSLKLAQPSTH